MWTPRNLTAEEQFVYNRIVLDFDEAKLVLEEQITAIRDTHDLPPEASIDPKTGEFIIVRTRLSREGQPINLTESLEMGAADTKERKVLAKAHVQVMKAQNAVGRMLNKLRIDCSAPATAMLTMSYSTWVNAETQRPFVNTVVMDSAVPQAPEVPVPQAPEVPAVPVAEDKNEVATN